MYFQYFLTDQLRRLFSSISLSYKSKYDRKGPLFSPRLKRVGITSENKFKYLLVYIHHNPIHHGLVTNYSEWKYSSYQVYVNDLISKIGKEEVLVWIGGLDVFNLLHDEFKLDYEEMINLDVE